MEAWGIVTCLNESRQGIYLIENKNRVKKKLTEKKELFITGDVDDVAIIIYDFACRISN